MAYLDPKEAFEHLKERTLEGIQAHFPMKGRTQTLHLEKLEIPDTLEHDNIQAQHQAKVTGGTWSVPVKATLALKNNETAWAWGSNSYGQLGNGSTNSSPVPVGVQWGTVTTAL